MSKRLKNCISGRIPKVDAVRDLLSRINPDEIRSIHEEMIDIIKRNRVFREGTIGGYVVAGLDGVELFSSTKKSCPNCLSRKKHTGETEYFYRSVVCMIIGKSPHVILGQEMLKPRDGSGKDEGELTGGKRLIERLKKRHGHFADVIVADALYLNAPFINTLKENGLEGVIRLKDERRMIFQDAERLFKQDEDKAYFAKMLTGTDENIEDSIRKLSQLLYKHHGKKAVIIIDEYDVPLDKAYQNGYYREMVSLIRGLFGQALKTNNYLQFAFLTGCLRVSKESIFTGLNNFKVLSIMDSRFDEQFGFTDDEVKKLLASYGLASHFPETKEWYDGYHFGNADVYCPWDVINYVDELNYDQTVEPQDYWSNSSGNAIVRRLIDKADVQTKDEIERLIAGECIEKELSQELTYDELDKNIGNLWSVLFTTGYLTKQGRTADGKIRLAIPNKEIKNLFIKKIREWFRDTLTANE